MGVVRDRTYLISERNVGLLNILEFNFHMKKSEIVNFSIELLAKTIKDLCEICDCNTVQARKLIVQEMEKDDYSLITS